MLSIRSVAVIGAGIAGAAAAHRLTAAGLDVTVIDKGRGVGGRMATRRLSADLSFDHGAQHFTARDPLFIQQVEAWIRHDVVGAWGAEPGWFVGAPTMTAPVRALTQGLAVLTHCAVTRIERDGDVWRLVEGPGGFIADGRAYDAVLVTAPAPQTTALLATAGVKLPALARVRYAPCWALMLAHDGPPLMAEPSARAADPKAALAWVARNDSKPGRGGALSTLVAHASPAWSRAHLECDPAEIAGRLQAELAQVIGSPLPEVRYAAAHRWRFALVEEAVGEPCLWRPEAGLGVAGDGCLGGRVEAAYLSGRALAERVLADA